MSLANLLKIGRLKPHAPNGAEIRRLLAAARRNIDDARVETVSDETRFDAATLARFEAFCACRVKQDYYSDNEEMLAKLEAGAVGYDLLVPTGNAVESLIRRGARRPLDKSLLPHLDNVKPDFRAPWFDPDSRHAVPYATTVTLIGYNVEKLRALNLPTDTWAL
ncbi:MAG: hypothetical protein Q7U97_12660, partial [Rhodocyclaceae bacterium]|nr:hypothetical protein [Rhodocyclaceae bacterium]